MRLFIIFSICLFIITSCSNSRVSELEKENQALKNSVSQMETENNRLKAEIEKLRKTDQNYFIEAVERFDSAEKSKSKMSYQTALEQFNELIQFFPNSQYITKARNYIALCERNIKNIDLADKLKDEINTAVNEHSFKTAYSKLSKLKPLISQEEYDRIKQIISNEANKPLLVSARDLVADAGRMEADKYFKKRVRVNSLKVARNNHQRGSFDTYLSTGNSFYAQDTDVRLEIFYRYAKNYDVCKELVSKNRPIISAIGEVKIYSNDVKRVYIDADEIIIHGDSY